MSGEIDSQTMVFQCGPFEFHNGQDFLADRNRAAQEFMQHHLDGEPLVLNDDRFYFGTDVDEEIDSSLLCDNSLLAISKLAPLASWVLARLMFLSRERYPSRMELHYDGGGWCFDYYVIQMKSPVAWLQLQGTMNGVVIVGTAIDPETASQIVSTFVNEITSDVEEVIECRYTVTDPEWEFAPEYFEPRPGENAANHYGWENGVYLGGDNIRETE